ncbi:hypothetical protein AgCh_040100 [Apium graveolens]
MLVLGSEVLNVIARQRQTATSISTRPSMNLQHGDPSGLSALPTGRTGMPSTLAHTIFIVTLFFGHISGTEGGVSSPGIGGSGFWIGGGNPGTGGDKFGLGGDNPGILGTIFGLGGDNPGIVGTVLGLGGDNPGIVGTVFGLGGDNPGTGATVFGLGGDNPGTGATVFGFGGGNRGKGGSCPLTWMLKNNIML